MRDKAVNGHLHASLAVPGHSADEVKLRLFIHSDRVRTGGVDGHRKLHIARVVIFLLHLHHVVLLIVVFENCMHACVVHNYFVNISLLLISLLK